jgi:hypothetical protein
MNVNITRLHIHYRTMNGKSKVKKVKPTDNTSSLRIKHDLATALNKIKSDVDYYYVVMEIDKDGAPAFRTIVPKTFING